MNESEDKSSLEERATERRKCHHSRMLDYNGRGWSENEIRRRKHKAG